MKFIYQYLIALWFIISGKAQAPTCPGRRLFQINFSKFSKKVVKTNFVAGWTLPPFLNWKQSADHNHLDRGWKSITFLPDRIRIITDRLYVPEQPPHWITDNPFGKYHYGSSRLVSRQAFTAPFHIYGEMMMPNIKGITPALWLINDLQEKTREIDLFETNEKSFYCSVHWGGHNYENRQMKNVVVPVRTKYGWHYPEAWIYEDYVVSIIDGVKIAEFEMDSKDVPYHVIIGCGVTGWPRAPIGFDIKSLRVSAIESDTAINLALT